jgi:hypothetical protein
MAAIYWAIPIRVSRSNPGRRIKIQGTGKERRWGCSPARQLRRRAVQVVVGGEVPMVGDGYGVLDNARKMMASS